MNSLRELNPFTVTWINRCIEEPLLEGISRIERAVSNCSLSWEQRAISFVIGIPLCIPLIGVVIWISWQRFGHPESLLLPPLPPLPAPPPPAPIAPPVALVAPVAAAAAAPEEMREYDDTNWIITKNGGRLEYGQCQYKHLPIRTQAWYREGQIQKMIRTEGERIIEMHLQGNQVIAKCGNVTKTHTIPKGFFWVQQPTLGLEPFFRSNDRELNYCLINTKQTITYMGVTIEALSLVKMKAYKTTPGKLEFFFPPPWPIPEMVSRQALLGYLEYDPKTFVVLSIHTTGLLGVKESTMLVSPLVSPQNHPLPAPAPS